MFKKGNFGRLRARLEALSEVPEKVAATTLRDCAYRVKETAINMTPIDEGDLRRSIKVRRIGGGTNKLGQFSRGQSRWEVYVNMSQPTSGGKKEAFVGEYAWLIHEHMGWGNVRMSIMPSERSVAAGLANGVHAGGRFMDRALMYHAKEIQKDIRAQVLREIKKLDK